MKYLLFVPLLLCSFFAAAQRDATEVFATKKGPLVVHPVLHGSVVFEWAQKAVYVDPYGGAEAFVGLPAPDIILITHKHGDHLNTATLAGLPLDKATFVVPQSVAEELPDSLQAQVRVLANDEKTKLHKLKIKALPMYNLPNDSTARHPKGWGNGYLLDFGKRIVYISGDTEDIPEMRALEKVDIAFVCMNLPYTMDVDQAISAVRDFAPEVVFPYHYRGKDGLSDVKRFKEEVESTHGDRIEVRLKNWYPSFTKRED